MAWEVIFGSDPRFLELVGGDIDQQEVIKAKISEIEQDPQLDEIEKVLAVDEIAPALWPLLSVDCEHPERYILFYDPTTGETARHSYEGTAIVPISSLEISSYESVYRLLEKRYDEFPELLRSIRLGVDCELNLYFHMHLVDYPGLRSAVCTLQVHARGTKATSGRNWSSPYSVYFDKSIPDCYEWFRQLERTIVAFFPKTSFGCRIGICNECSGPLRLEEHGIECAGAGIFLCDSCLDNRKVRRLVKEEEQRKEQAQRRLERKLKTRKEIFPEQMMTIPNPPISEALYKAYGGKCQYCFMPEALPREQIIIEHIIPRSLPLEKVPEKLLGLGISGDQVQNFCSTFLPPHHNCVLNLIPACFKHNAEKRADLLHPATLEFMLRKARRKARKVLEIYSMLNSKG